MVFSRNGEDSKPRSEDLTPRVTEIHGRVLSGLFKQSGPDALWRALSGRMGGGGDMEPKANAEATVAIRKNEPQQPQRALLGHSLCPLSFPGSSKSDWIRWKFPVPPQGSGQHSNPGFLDRTLSQDLTTHHHLSEITVVTGSHLTQYIQ